MDNTTNNQIYIQDYIVRTPVDKSNLDADLIGECNDASADEFTQAARVYEQISILVNDVSQLHQNEHCINIETPIQSSDSRMLVEPNSNSNLNFLKIKQESENHITRLVTNEFMFYTKKRFNAEEFSNLFSDILNLAKKQPENLHLVLSSFAVKALNKKTMNVVAFITCGKNPTVHFIVKSHASRIDPIYYRNKNGQRKPYLNIDIRTNDTKAVFPKLNIQGREYQFSYNNISEITTLGGAKKIIAIEICLDHDKGLAKKNCQQFVESGLTYPLKIFPNQVSQIVTSNSIDLEYDKKLEDNPTHADPRIKSWDCKPRSEISVEKSISSVFGSKTLNCIIMDSTPCSKLPQDLLTQVENYNERRYVFVHPSPNIGQLINQTMTQGYQLFSNTLDSAKKTFSTLYHGLIDNSTQKRPASDVIDEHRSTKKHKKNIKKTIFKNISLLKSLLKSYSTILSK